MALPDPLTALARDHDLSFPLVVRAGSKAYGLDVEGSDDDTVGVFVATLRTLVSIDGLHRDTYTGEKPDFTVHEIGKFCRLALRGNPAILEVLWSEEALQCDALGRELVDGRRRFIHRGSLEVYVSYAAAQLKKMAAGKGIHARGGVYGTKFGMHLIRLLKSGLALGRTGEVTVRIPAREADLLREIRSGQQTMQQVIDLALPLLEDLQRLSADNGLPPEPDRRWVEDLVVRARMSR